MIYTIGVWLMTILGVGYVVEAAWRLRRHRPAQYLSTPGELLIAAAFIVGIFVSMPTEGLVGVVAKSIASAGWAAGAVLRVITRQRFAVRP